MKIVRIEHRNIDGLGWNHITVNEQNNFAVLAQQLNMIGHLLIDIRELLESEAERHEGDES